MSPPYKGPNGAFLTASLFWGIDRWSDDRTNTIVFSLDEDRPNLINCRKTFIECGDLTGYDWAMKYLHSWEHMEKLLTKPWFRIAFESWQRELVVALRSAALKKLIVISEGDDRSAPTAARWIVEEGWNENTKHTRGRPSKAEVAGAIKQEASDNKIINDDLERLGLKVISGGKEQ